MLSWHVTKLRITIRPDCFCESVYRRPQNVRPAVMILLIRLLYGYLLLYTETFVDALIEFDCLFQK